MSSSDQETSDEKPAQRPMAQRRSFLRASFALALVAVFGSIGAIAKSLVIPSASPPTPGSSSTGSGATPASLTFPKVRVANLSDLASGKPITFNYPLQEAPNLLVKLGVKAQGGVGPEGDIVAFSQVCQHLGCIYGYVPAGATPACDNTYRATGPVGYCCCHGSVFDLTAGATVLDGPAERPQPQVVLQYDASTGDLYATGMTPPSIFGHATGSNDVTKDLQGGTLVS
ncbi:MAG TPA: arsenate reductase (azurin) small subunit [Conexivisphaerales archaeon]|nr:arsenate reductase (azurin) small subunit [Conexivisphaerales archaeon]